MKMERNLMENKAELLKVLGHPVRLCIVKGLLDVGENNVSYMQGCLEVPQSTISQHLAKLKAAGVINSQRKGTEVYYSISDKSVRTLINTLFQEYQEEIK